MFGLLFAKRSDEEHWWDRDPEVRARNLRLERSLADLMHGGDEPPESRGKVEMLPLLAAALKYGLTPVLLAWLLILGVTEFRSDLKASRDDARTALATVERHAHETIQRMDRYDRTQERIVNLLRAQCINTAKNTQERNDCLRAGL